MEWANEDTARLLDALDALGAPMISLQRWLPEPGFEGIQEEEL